MRGYVLSPVTPRTRCGAFGMDPEEDHKNDQRAGATLLTAAFKYIRGLYKYGETDFLHGQIVRGQRRMVWTKREKL